MSNDNSTAPPLSPLTMAILLALADGALHGYALMREVERQTEGTLTPGTGSLYAALYRLADEGLIEEAPADVDESRGSGESGRESRASDESHGSGRLGRKSAASSDERHARKRARRTAKAGASHPGRPRKRYRITAAGEALARAEATRMKRVVAIARRRLGDEGGRRDGPGHEGGLAPARGDA